MTSAERQKLIAKKTQIEAEIDSLSATILEASKHEISKYRLDSGIGSQMTERRLLNDLIKSRELLENQLQTIEARLSKGSGIRRIF